jgi:hypothetical protein
VIAERKPWIRPVEVIIIAVGILLCVGLFVTFQQNRVLTDVQSQGIERGYKNRAVTCDLQTALGVGNSRECRSGDPTVPGSGGDPDGRCGGGACGGAGVEGHEGAGLHAVRLA